MVLNSRRPGAVRDAGERRCERRRTRWLATGLALREVFGCEGAALCRVNPLCRELEWSRLMDRTLGRAQSLHARVLHAVRPGRRQPRAACSRILLCLRARICECDTEHKETQEAHGARPWHVRSGCAREAV